MDLAVTAEKRFFVSIIGDRFRTRGMKSLKGFFGHTRRDESRDKRSAFDAVNASILFVDPGFDEGFVELPVRVGPVPEAPVKIREKTEAAFFSGFVRKNDLPNLNGVFHVHEDRFFQPDPVKLACQDRVPLPVAHFEKIVLRHARLPGPGPIIPVIPVSDINIFSPVVADQVLVPAGNARKVRVVAP